MRTESTRASSTRPTSCSGAPIRRRRPTCWFDRPRPWWTRRRLNDAVGTASNLRDVRSSRSAAADEGRRRAPAGSAGLAELGRRPRPRRGRPRRAGLPRRREWDPTVVACSRGRPGGRRARRSRPRPSRRSRSGAGARRRCHRGGSELEKLVRRPARAREASDDERQGRCNGSCSRHRGIRRDHPAPPSTDQHKARIGIRWHTGHPTNSGWIAPFTLGQ